MTFNFSKEKALHIAHRIDYYHTSRKLGEFTMIVPSTSAQVIVDLSFDSHLMLAFEVKPMTDRPTFEEMYAVLQHVITETICFETEYAYSSYSSGTIFKEHVPPFFSTKAQNLLCKYAGHNFHENYYEWLMLSSFANFENQHSTEPRINYDTDNPILC